MKKYQIIFCAACALLVLGVLLGVLLIKRPPQLELQTEEDSVPAFGEKTETEETEETKDTDTKEKDFRFTVSPANTYFGKELYHSALNAEKMNEDGVQHLPIFKMENAGDLAAFQNAFGNSLSRESDRAEYPSFETVAKKYNDEFFKDNTLFVIYVTPDSGSYRYGIRDVGGDGEALTVFAEQTNHPTAVTMDLVGWLISVEIPKTATENKTAFDATLTRPKR